MQFNILNAIIIRKLICQLCQGFSFQLFSNKTLLAWPTDALSSKEKSDKKGNPEIREMLSSPVCLAKADKKYFSLSNFEFECDAIQQIF